MLLGRVVKSNSHVDYVVQVFAPGEVAEPPRPEDYAFGSFVRIAVDGRGDGLVGIIYDTLLLNPAYGTLGPRLSGEPQLTAFAPDYMPETATVVGIAIVGQCRGEGEGANFRQGVPPLAARVGSEARRLTDEEFGAFHRGDGQPTVSYLPRLSSMNNSAMPELLNDILTRLIAAFPDSSGTLQVLRTNLDWSARLPRG
jgi:hypothetical protein